MRRLALTSVPILALLAVTFWSGHWRLNTPGPEWTVRGIDWHRVAAAGYSFAYIKATEGGDHRDSLFQNNWRDAQAAGLRRGAYHFFTLCRPGADQAAAFIAAVPLDGELPPSVDLEFGG